MKSMPVSEPTLAAAPAGRSAGLGRRVGTWFVEELREVLPPTLFFFVGFNLIVLTTNLILADYRAAFTSFALATATALVVGKAVLVSNAIPLLRLYDRAPLLWPILFKTVFYWAVVFIVRLLEHFIRYWLIEHQPLGGFLPHMLETFSWHRFAAIQIWIFVLFLIYVAATEFNDLFGRGEVWRALVTHRPTQLQLNRRQRARELARLGRLADTHLLDEFRDPSNLVHRELIAIMRRLARRPPQDVVGAADER